MKGKLCKLFLGLCLFFVFQCESDAKDAKDEKETMLTANELNQKGVSLISSDPEEAIRLFKAAGELDPKFPDYANNVGVVKLNQGKIEEAIGFFETSVKKQPNYHRGYYNLGISYQKLGNFSKAIEYYQKALSLGESPEVIFNLALVNEKSGNKKSAVEYYKKFLSMTNKEQFPGPYQDAEIRIKDLSK